MAVLEPMRALAEALPLVFLTFSTELLARARVTSVAEFLCRLGSRWFPEEFRTERAFVRCYAGDLEEALRLLDESLPGDDWAFLRALHSGLMCEHHQQNRRAADFFELMLSLPDPQTCTENPINPEFRPSMRDHILKLRTHG